jgi:hypothetical protein
MDNLVVSIQVSTNEQRLWLSAFKNTNPTKKVGTWHVTQKTEKSYTQ